MPVLSDRVEHDVGGEGSLLSGSGGGGRGVRVHSGRFCSLLLQSDTCCNYCVSVYYQARVGLKFRRAREGMTGASMHKWGMQASSRVGTGYRAGPAEESVG